MAAAMMSLSESIQASLIIKKSLNPRPDDQLCSRQQQQQHGQKGIGFFVQILLVSALFGIEMVIAFEQINLMLIHQFLGVPVSLLSFNGIICGIVSMTFLPLVGYWSDKGANPKKRKLFSLFIGMSMFLCGLLFLATGGFIKLSSMEDFDVSKHVNNESSAVTIFPSTYEITNIADLTTSMTSPTVVYPQQNNTKHQESTDSFQLPLTAIFSIIGFSFIDIGFDTSTSITRAFILENVPLFQHTRLLVLSTIAASVAGTTFSFIGCFDLPGVLEPLFHAEGVTVTLIFFCILLFCLIVTGYSLTIITGCVLGRRSRKLSTAHHSGYSKINNTTETYADNEVLSPSRKILTAERCQQRTEPCADPPYIPDILHTEEGDPTTRPLLLENSFRGSNYWALSISTSSIVHCSDNQTPRVPAMKPKQNTLADKETGDMVNAFSKPEKCIEFQDKCDDVDNKQNTDARESPINTQSCSMTLSHSRSPLDDLHNRKLERLQNQKSHESNEDDNKLRMNKRLVILCFSCFFTFGCLVSFIVYISNALNIGIFHGDPTSRPGTEAYAYYQSGLRTAALGNLVLYVTYMIISVNNTRILKLIGEKVQFVGCHVFLIVSLLGLLLTKRVEVYFVFMVSCGGLRTCVFTLPFVLAHKFTQDQESDTGNKSSGKESKNLGKVMSLIGFLIPAHYVILSAFMGPLMSSTGNVWVPLIYSLCCCSLSLIIFSFLFFVKH